ncbi:MAG: hypothetical protein ACMUIG_04455 [Thermoplasmatota archaeon]
MYDHAESIPKMFELVKKLVEHRLRKHRAGLMLGMTDLGITNNGFVGAYFTVGSNAIIVNRQALNAVQAGNPDLYKPYMFYILMHEYIHSLGYTDEAETRSIAAGICRYAFGRNHDVTRIASDFSGMLNDIVMPKYGEIKPYDGTIELIAGFDQSSTSYIQ